MGTMNKIENRSILIWITDNFQISSSDVNKRIVYLSLIELYQQAHEEVMTDKEFSEFVKQSSDPIHTYSGLVMNRFKRLVRDVMNE